MRGRLLGLIVIAAWSCVPAATWAGTPRLSRLQPPGGQRGSTLEVQLVGRYLERPEELLLYEPGITVESIEPVVGEAESAGRRERIEPNSRLRVRLKISEDCPLGAHGLRLRTAHGVTEFQRFFVGPYPLVDEAETQQNRNDQREAAQAVSLNQTINGRLQEQVDVDWYRVEAERGARLSAEIEAARLGTDRGVPDLHVSIVDAMGKTLAAADDSALFVQDPIVSMVAPETGVYFVAVRHSIYNAANEVYRLHLGTFLRPTGLFPAGGPAGQELTVKVLGDPLGETSRTVRLPDSPGRDWSYAAPDAGGLAPTPNVLRVSPYGNVLEGDANDTPEAVATGALATLPIAFNGIIEKPGDVDYFRFTAKKGERYRLRALANALGSPLDPTLTVVPLGGIKAPPVRATDSRLNQLGLPPTAGLNRETLDPTVEFTAPADGEYAVRVEDDRGGGGPEYVYRIEAEVETDAVLTYIPLEPENQQTPQARQAIAVPAGNRYNTSVAIFNVNRPYDGELELVALGLPAGVTMEAARLTPGQTRVPVVFVAAADTKPSGGFVEIVARPVSGEGKRDSLPSGFRQVIAMNAYGNNDFYLHTVVDRLAVAVTEPAPFSLEVETPKSALVQNGEMALKFRVRRAADFSGPVTVSMEWRPPGVTAATPMTIRGDQTEGEYLVSAARNASPGTNLVTLTCVSGGERPGYNDNANRIYVASAPFALKVAEPHMEAKFPRLSIERGKTSEVVVRLNALRPFEGAAKATLARLPRGVKLVEATREVSASDKEVRFTLEATDECLVGSYQGITLELTVLEDGQVVRQMTGYGSVRIDAERGATRKP